MIAIMKSQLVNPFAMNDALAGAGITGYIGLSTGGFGAIAYLDDGAPQASFDDVNAIFDGYGQLGVSSDKSTIVADDVELATITATAGPGDTSIRFDVWDSDNDHAVVNEVVAVAGGSASYQFKTALAETYTVFAYGNVSKQMGSVEVVANE